MAGSRVRRLQKEVEMEECLSHFLFAGIMGQSLPLVSGTPFLLAPRPGETEAPKVSVLGGISWRELTD